MGSLSYLQINWAMDADRQERFPLKSSLDLLDHVQEPARTQL